MDRFIDNQLKHQYQEQMNLKSNMDRFIASLMELFPYGFGIFKIQYG